MDVRTGDKTANVGSVRVLTLDVSSKPCKVALERILFATCVTSHYARLGPSIGSYASINSCTVGLSSSSS